jgi:hypothetical protein
LALRAGYIAKGCDFHDWSDPAKGRPERNPQDKQQSHWDAYRQGMRTVANCWKKYKELGCCGELPELKTSP